MALDLLEKPYSIGYNNYGGADLVEIKRTFIQTSAFSKAWADLGFTDTDLRRLENELLQNPKVGDVIRGTGKMRKMRFAFEGRGKSGSTRVCYVDFEIKETIYLLAVFAKNEIDNLSKAERNELRDLIDVLEANL
ncbi:MAG: type II toxin-antitoxin system RelE/ParE family toxin [Phascolarctobacterium sp.]|uniref:type II toxin-antitoxin system RelE/ParE family toxin n=1 Tax=Phascolarctobacterium sp. TaxID=2049039 RepID=UPI0026DCF7E4|nr:type II toxin-antitoxin system RelE/ParE family toxin [Phascolarctobacterium sp.]MDO4921184.1 type II toxin-antitoxin system RelE/ParE family toxin [Phascolarctobacterium sp.]